MTESTFQIQKLEGGGFDPTQVRLLVWGDSGAGKTRLACSFPDVLVLDIDRGLASVDWKIDSVQIESWEQIGDVFMFLKEGDHKYKSVVLDSLNEIQKMSMEHILQEFPSIRRSYDSMPQVSDWGKMLSDFETMLRYFKTLPMNNIWISQMLPQQYDSDFVMPQLSGKNTARNVSRMVDIIGYIYQHEKGNAISFHSTQHTTKDRSGLLPSVVENPTFEILEGIWSGRVPSTYPEKDQQVLHEE